jgi:beta-lactamase superfamily II metal-dependent hydrolase
MKLTIFQSNKGDCLLLSSGTGAAETHVLVDGGMRASYRQHVAKTIAKLPQLDLVYVSHIDQDHISGVLQLLDDSFAWRLYNIRTAKGVAHPRPKKTPEPPEILGIWHNAFQDQLPKNPAAVEDMLIATANIAAGREDLTDAAIRNDNYATSIPEALQLSARVGIKELGLKVNQGRGKLLMARKKQRAITVGPMSFTILAPFQEDLNKLRDEWKEWLDSKAGDKAVKRIRARSAEDAKAITASSFEDIAEQMLIQAQKLGDPSTVSAPNLASLMVLVEENGKTILLTGDGVGGTILKGLESTGKIAKGAPLHVNVLKVQHHGSKNNLDEAFAARVSADHYVFCGNGGHGNPHPLVVQRIFDSRVGDQRAPHAPNRKFHFWFNSHSSVTETRFRKNMRDLEALVAKLEKASGGKLVAHFLQKSAFPPLRV